MKPRARSTIFTAAMTLLMASSIAPWAHAELGLFTATGNSSITGSNLSAEAVFAVVNNSLQVTLKNTSADRVTDKGDVLTALFFNVSNDPGFTAKSATVVSPDQVWTATSKTKQGVTTYSYTSANPIPPGGNLNVNADWAFKHGVTISNQTFNYGISAAGIEGTFGNSDMLFPHSGNANIDGVDFGLVSGDTSVDKASFTVTDTPLTENSVVFNLGPVDPTFDLSRISNVAFHYGNKLTNSQIAPVPEPAFMQLGAMLLFGGFGVGLRRRRAAA